MIVVADFQPRYGWALKHRSTGQIYLHEICDDEESARALLRGMREHQQHRGIWDVVPVSIRLSLMPTGESS